MEKEHTHELLLALQSKLWCYAYSLTWDRYRADDLLQETSIRMLCNAGSFNGCSRQFAKWAHTIMHNTFLNSIRNEEIVCFVEDQAFAIPFVADNVQVQSCDERPHINDIYNAIDRLPGNAGKIMRMYIVGHQYVEIATHLQIPIGTVKTRISQARAILKEQLKDYLC